MGDGPGAREEWTAARADLESSLLLRVEAVRIDITYLRGAHARWPPRRAAPRARACSRPPSATPAPSPARSSAYAHTFARALSAAVAQERGQLDRAAALYAEAALGFEVLDMGLLASAMHWRLGGILLGDEGRALIDGAETRVRERASCVPTGLWRCWRPCASDPFTIRSRR